eukprot:gnl/MRDRNA2_/MRDRNA2_88036_c0_seq1.p1 gnl/MRDRNA2_/MRDRNA2_88036_c0~~gnl/MRDRNA2_/MRDRNA2_88036_c0_seq1.p1  ORF type:complete len:304 (+),score=83.80 gnl/MRDRNA2_/MRDRNA2_88036_c0_seq1:64-912(+)
MVNSLGFTDEEEKVVSLYLEEKLPPAEKLRRINEKIAKMLSTNEVLQSKLHEQEIICGELQGSASQLEISVAEQDEQLQHYKSQEAELTEQLNTVHQGQRSEELRMRNANMMLEERLNVLTRENTRLEDQKRDEEATIAENANRIKTLDHKLAALAERKAALEPEELSSIQSESAAPSEAAMAVDEEVQRQQEVSEAQPSAPEPAETAVPPHEDHDAEVAAIVPANPFPQAPGAASSASMLEKASEPQAVPAPPEQAPSGRRRPNRSSLTGGRGSFGNLGKV